MATATSAAAHVTPIWLFQYGQTSLVSCEGSTSCV